MAICNFLEHQKRHILMYFLLNQGFVVYSNWLILRLMQRLIKRAWIDLSECVHTANRQIPILFPIGSCIRFIYWCLCWFLCQCRAVSMHHFTHFRQLYISQMESFTKEYFRISVTSFVSGKVFEQSASYYSGFLPCFVLVPPIENLNK